MFIWLAPLLWSMVLKVDTEATVGLGANCRYLPNELPQAMMENSLIYLTNEFTISALHIGQNQTMHDDIHLIGGFDNCDAIELRTLGLRKTKISGANETVALKINTSVMGTVVLENFEISEGYSSHAGGVQVIQANQFKLKNSLIHNNSSENSGGGIQISGHGIMVDLDDSKIFNNAAKTVGGGIIISGDYNTLALHETKVFANQAGIAGGGLSCFNYNHIRVVSNPSDSDRWLSNNLSPLAENLYYDLSCQFHRSTNGTFGLSE